MDITKTDPTPTQADRRLVRRVRDVLAQHYVNVKPIRILCDGAVVRLTGRIANSSLRRTVPRILEPVLGGRDLENQLTVG